MGQQNMKELYNPHGRQKLTLRASLAAPGQSRKRLCNDGGIRSVLIVWDRQGRLPPYTQGWYGEPTWTWTDPDGRVYQVPRMQPGKDSTWFDPLYHGMAVVPGRKPGRWTLSAGGVSYAVDVVDTPKRKPRKTLGPDVPVTDVQSALDAGNDVLLRPGLYEWSVPLFLPTGARLTGPGAVVTYVGPLTAGSEWTVCLIRGGGAFAVVDGITFRTPPGCRVVAQQMCPSLTMVRCTFDSCLFANPGEDFYLEDCDFTGPTAGVWTFQGGLYRRCRWTDTSGGHPITCWSADGNYCIVDPVFRRTDRGPVMQADWGDIRGGLFLGVQVYDVCWSENGCESFLCEPTADRGPYGFHDNLIFHYRLRAGAGGGTLVQWDGRASGNLVMEANSDGGESVKLWGTEVRDNDFVYVELRNGGPVLFGIGSGNWFRSCAIINPLPGKYGQHWLHPAGFQAGPAARTVDGYPADAVNGFEDSEFWLPAGMEPAAAGVELLRCRRNGQPVIDAAGPS